MKSINLSCLFCPSPTLPVQALLHSRTSSGQWMAHCYACSSVAAGADAMSSRNTGPCTRLVARIQREAVNYIPQTHKHFALNWVFGSLEHHWRGIAYPDFCLSEERFHVSRGSGPAVHDCGLDGEITHGQLGFELLTPAFLGSTAWWPQGSTSSKRPSSSELADLFWLSPCGTITPWRLEEVILFGRIWWSKVYKNNIWIVCMHISDCIWTKNATNTFLNGNEVCSI